MAPDLLTALAPVLEALSRLRVRHFVGGSIASSAHGVPRASIDADVIAELRPVHGAELLAALSGGYYVPHGRALEAIAGGGSFNVIHLGTMVKVDLFVVRDRPFDRRALDRAGTAAFEDGTLIPVSSPEDTLLAKLDWYRKGGEISERQWADVLGLFRAGQPLDQAYLDAGARELGVLDLLGRAQKVAEGERSD